MQYLYALINFVILAGIVVLFGRKKIVSIFRSRRERINSERDEAESGISKAEAVPAPLPPPSDSERQLLAMAEEVKAAAREKGLALKSQYEYYRRDKHRAMLTDARGEFIERVRTRAAELMAVGQYREKLQARESELVGRILDRIEISHGDMAYLARHDVLYVTLTSAAPMSDASVERIGARVSEMLAEVGGKPSYWVRVDEALIAGFRLRIGDTIYDCTAQNSIGRLCRDLAKLPLSGDTADAMVRDMLAAVDAVETDIDEFQVGRVISVSDGICWLDGLSDIMYGELVEFECGERGVVLDIEPERVGCIIFGRYEHIDSYSRVRRLGVMASVPVGGQLLGRVVTPTGKPIDGKGRIWSDERRPIEFMAPPIPDRKSVSRPLHTGIKTIDALVPIGRGQRELIIGDRQTGKTSIAIDTIINQKGKNVACIYVAIGQKESAVADIVHKLEKYGAMEYTTVVCATASNSASMQYIAPFAGAAMGEYFMYAGRDALIVYDDLSKHAVAYRELSLLLHRPSGREAYPGDIFYLHARLLERAAQLSDEAGGGSVTALPVIETQAGDISAYIPTNVISITDGQIFLETELFNEGQRPAVNVGLSVSRVGSAAQTKLMKQVSSQLRTSLAQYRELETFAQFGADLNDSTKRVLGSGARMMAALKQGRYAPIPDWKQALLIFAVSSGFAAKVGPDAMEEFASELFSRFESRYADMAELLKTGKKLSADSVRRLNEALTELTEE